VLVNPECVDVVTIRAKKKEAVVVLTSDARKEASVSGSRGDGGARIWDCALSGAI
jgi:hypothetical protein